MAVEMGGVQSPEGIRPVVRRRRWPWVVLGAVAVVIVLVVSAASWVLSGMIGDSFRIPQPAAGYPMTITAVDATSVSYSGVPSGWTDQGRYAISTADGGYVQTDGDPTVGFDGTGTRTVTSVLRPPALAVGQQAALDGWYYGDDPAAALGRRVQQVSYDTPQGPAAAWVVPGTSTTWVVYAHGRSDLPAQGLRLATTATQRGYPMMLIQYRNDPDAPAGNGYGHFGTDEWADLEAAVRYALDNGATNVVLAGTSMGGSMAVSMLENSDLADSVVGLVLDAPALNIGATVDKGVADFGLPSFVGSWAKQVASWRFGLDWSGMDYVSRAGELTVPVLITQGTGDETALPAVARAFASAAPAGLVQVEEFEGAGHTLAWNTEPERYDALVGDFLDRVA